MINIKNLSINKIKIDEKSCKAILIYYSGYVMIKNPSSVTTDLVNPLCLIINKTNRCIEKSNGNEYLTLFPTDDSEDKLKKYDKL